ncbi:hypothetical protein AAFF_G00265350 [Aldrovandia affinis]|uniref:Uncharacterized protein n=1 Tax=Aldrovandia affinis TaxID=143900 RepID=A0AAD7RBF3_9TELE|nr:hypothetical protein AAFF_G00265350 [Aldrovandia affinis]
MRSKPAATATLSSPAEPDHSDVTASPLRAPSALVKVLLPIPPQLLALAPPAEKTEAPSFPDEHVTAESETVSVPVTALPPAPVNPPALEPPRDAPLTQATVERMVKEILEKQQQQQQQKMMRTCLTCGQPKSRCLRDGSSIY